MSETPPRRDVTELLEAWSTGDRNAPEKLIPLVIDDLRGVARRYLARERPGHTLEPTALVNEAYLRLAGRRKVQFASRVQFFAVLAKTMRHILVDHARSHRALRRGSGHTPVPLDKLVDLPVQVDVDLIALDDALKDLQSFAPRQGEAVQLSYFGGLNFDEIATVLEVSPVTVKRDLKAAKVWLYRELQPKHAP